MNAKQRETLELVRGDMDNTLDDGRFYLCSDAVDALTAALGTCGTCQHIDDVTDTHGQCLAPNHSRFPFRCKAMPLGERCTGWEAQS